MIYLFGEGLKIFKFLEKQLKTYFAAKIWHTTRAFYIQGKKLGVTCFLKSNQNLMKRKTNLLPLKVLEL